MPAAKDAPAPEEAKPKAEPKAKKPDPRELADELELLKAQGNPDPDRVAEIKQLLAEARR